MTASHLHAPPIDRNVRPTAGGDAEQLEKLSETVIADALRIAGAGQRHVVQARPLRVAAEIEGNAAERAIALAANVDQVCRGQRAVPSSSEARVRLPDLHQPGWFVERQRLGAARRARR